MFNNVIEDLFLLVRIDICHSSFSFWSQSFTGDDGVQRSGRLWLGMFEGNLN